MSTEKITLSVSLTHDELKSAGPYVQVTIRPKGGTELTDIVALIDTGASHSCIRQGVADKLGISPNGVVLDPHPNGTEPEYISQFPISIIFPNKVEVAVDVTVHRIIKEPYDLLIGRDILGDCLLEVNFIDGHWTLSFG